MSAGGLEIELKRTCTVYKNRPKLGRRYEISETDPEKLFPHCRVNPGALYAGFQIKLPQTDNL